MSLYYLKPLPADAERLNAILYFRYVTEDGVNFKFPYDSQTTEFVDWQSEVFTIGDKTLEAVTDPQISIDDQNFIAALLVFKKDEAEAIAAGWAGDN